MCNDPRDLSPDEIPFEDIAVLVGRYYQPTKKTLTKLFEIVTRPGSGHFGLLMDILDRAWSTCKLNQVPMSDELVQAEMERTLENLAAQPNTLRE
jgi:hypothetical protein